MALNGSDVVEACSSTPTPTGDAGADASANTDVATLNALLTAEYAAIKAYDAGAAVLAAPGAMDPQRAVAPVVLAWHAAAKDTHFLRLRVCMRPVSS